MLPMKRRRKDSSLEGCEPVSAQMKVRQSCKLRELGDALLSAGFLTLDAQANALGLARSTTWTILTGNSAQRHNFVARQSISGAGHAAHEKTEPKTSCGLKRA
jgi:hypothetical protein